METDPRFQPTWLLRAVCRGHGRGFSEFVGWSVGETASIKPSLDRRTQPPTRSTHGYDGGKRASGRHGARARTLGTPLAPLAALAAGASHSRRHRIGLTDPAQQTNAHPTKWPELEKNQLGTERRNSFFVETSEQSPTNRGRRPALSFHIWQRIAPGRRSCPGRTRSRRSRR
jgi:hypothetical protein